jgi:hypothetical protein
MHRYYHCKTDTITIETEALAYTSFRTQSRLLVLRAERPALARATAPCAQSELPASTNKCSSIQQAAVPAVLVYNATNAQWPKRMSSAERPIWKRHATEPRMQSPLEVAPQ